MGALYLIRHGQASFGAAEYDQLSPVGVEQAAALGRELVRRGMGPASVVRGSMRRHAQTAEHCMEAMGSAIAVAVDPGWDEYDHEDVLAAFGERYRDKGALAEELSREADPRRAFQHLFGKAVARWTSGAHEGYRETFAAFRGRVRAAFDALCTRLGKGESALVLTSGGPIAVVAGTLLGVPAEQQLDLGWHLANAAVTKVLVRNGAPPVLSTLNEHAHFEGAARHLLTYR
jgi:broad specificity phosphatase PhoE